MAAAGTAVGARVGGSGARRGRVGVAAVFQVQLVDASGQDVSDDAAELGLAFSGPAGVEAGVDELGNGAYTVEYTASVSGRYEITVTLNGNPVAGSPFVSHIYTADAPLARNPSLHSNQHPTVNSKILLEFDLLDENGAILEEEIDIGLEISGPGAAEADLEQTHPGKFVVTLQVKDAGLFVIRAVSDEVVLFEFNLDVAAEPVKQTVVVTSKARSTAAMTPASAHSPLISVPSAASTPPPKTVDVSKTVLRGEGLKSAQTGIPSTFTVELFDHDGNKVLKGGQVQVTVSGDQKVVEGAVVDENNGTFEVVYEVETSGDHKINVKVNGTEAPGSPFKITVTSPADSTKCLVSGAISQAMTNRDNSIILQLCSADGRSKKVSSGDVVEAFFSGNNSNSISGGLLDNGDGTYEFIYEATEPGVYSLVVQVNEEQIDGSPFSINISSGIDASQCYAYGEGLGRVETETPSTFSVQAVDAQGKNLSVGGASLKVHIDGDHRDTATGAVIDNNNGTYDIVWQAHEAGRYSVNVSVNDEPIRGSPFVIAVVAQIDPALSFAKVDKELRISVGEVLSVSVQSFTNVGLPGTRGGQQITAYLQGHAGRQAIAGAVVDNDDGTYDVVFEVKEPGRFALAILMDGYPIKGSPYNVLVGDAAADPEQCRVAGLNSKTILGAPNVMVLITLTGTGEYKRTGGDKVESHLDTPSGLTLECEVTDNADGTYDVIYVAGELGRHFLTVILNGEVVNGSPFTVNVVDDAGVIPLPPKRLLVLQTGGTIDQEFTKSGAFVIGEEPAVKRVLSRLASIPYKVEYTSVYRKTTLATEDFEAISSAAFAPNAAHHVLITADTKALLGLGAHFDGLHGNHGPNHVIVLTGAFTPERLGDTDAPFNIGAAVGALTVLPPGVYLAVSGLIIPASNARQLADGSFAFAS